MAQLKDPTTYQEQIELLKSRNIRIGDTARCAEVLENVNYYRFTAYFLPFKQADGLYQEGTQFAQVYQIYEFDRKFRSVLFAALEEIEIYLRAKFAYFHAHAYGAEGYMDASNFSPAHQEEKFKENLNREIFNNRRSAFVAHHQEKYDGHFPIWVVVELFTFGMLSRFYSDLKTCDQKQLAKALYGTVPKNIISWLRCCTDLRNICAHYGRLYYRKFPATPANVDANSMQKTQLWGAVLAVKALYPEKEKWNIEVLPHIVALLKEYGDSIILEHIGFPVDWEKKLCYVDVEKKILQQV